MSYADKVLVALKDKGPMRMQDLGAFIKCKPISTVCRKLEAEKKLQISVEKRNAMVALPEQKMPEETPASSKPRAGKSRKKGKKKANRGRRAARRPVERNAEPAFIAAVTADTTLVLIGKGPEPLVFTVEQTEKIATLMFAHFNG